MSRAVSLLVLALLAFASAAPGFAQSTVRVAPIAAERDCQLYETYWGSWLILECRNNFAELRTRIQSALAESRRFSLAAGGRAQYVVTGTITELGVTEAASTGRDYSLARSRAVASFDMRLQDAASGRIVHAATITRSVEIASHLSAGAVTTGGASSPRAIYAQLQREIALAAARAAAAQVDPPRVTAASGRMIRINYGAPLVQIDDVVQVGNAAGFPVRFRVTEAMADGAIAETAELGATVAVGTAATFLDGGGPAAGMNRFARAELPNAGELGSGYVAPISRPTLLAPPPAAPAAHPQAMRGEPQQQPRRRLSANRGEQPTPAAPARGPPARIALVVGVSAYGTLGDLPNPANDARALAATLQQLGFDVELVVDPEQRAFKDAISRLGERMGRSGAGSTGLFYFAGHGIQSRGVNYLVPSNAAIRREADLDLEAVPADTVLSQMQEAEVSTNIIILDACRNMPLTRSFRSAGQGLAQMEAPNGSFIAYSTAPGSVAADGAGLNSPFATALLRELASPAQPIEAVFRNVRRAVLQQTEGQQTPWDSSSLTEPFFFRGE